MTLQKDVTCGTNTNYCLYFNVTARAAYLVLKQV
jgi:hypothetical protein